MLSKHAAQINTIINALAIIVLILALIAGFWTYTNKDAVEYLHQKIKQKIQTDNNFKTIEVAMYDQTIEKIKNIIAGTKKEDAGKITAEIMQVTNLTTKILSGVFGLNQIRETRNFDITITIKLLVNKKDNKYYFEGNEIKIGAPITIDFEAAFVNGTIQTVR